ncbi:MAG TPA: SCO6880 family protein, partial [Acidimicrobiales bacterium]|nr:SCO6880 family protein [Acidimicrobiales bacterium]
MADSTYRFEPLSRRGLVLGLGAGQLVIIVAALLGAVLAIKAWPGITGFALAAIGLAAAAFLCRPVGGRPALHWLLVGGSYFGRRRRAVTRPPGHLRPAEPRRANPVPRGTPVRGTVLDEVPGSDAQGPIGVLLDTRAGTAAAVLTARGGSFCLLDSHEKERRLGAWAGVLEALATSRTSLARLQWCQRARRADSESLLAHLRSTGDAESPGYEEHAAVVEGAGGRAWRHETFLVVVAHSDLRRRQ